MISVVLTRFAAEADDEGRLKREQGQFFYSFCLDEVIPDDHRVSEIARYVGPILGPRGACATLLAAGSSIDRSGADPDAHRGLCLRHPLGAAALP
jgi:hypothetical protein